MKRITAICDGCGREQITEHHQSPVGWCVMSVQRVREMSESELEGTVTSKVDALEPRIQRASRHVPRALRSEQVMAMRASAELTYGMQVPPAEDAPRVVEEAQIEVCPECLPKLPSIIEMHLADRKRQSGLYAPAF